MKNRFWDTENKCWYTPVYQADKGNLEELLITMSGELCLRKLVNGEVQFIHQSAFEGRFITSTYTTRKDSNGKKIFTDDILFAPKNQQTYIVCFGIFRYNEQEYTGYYIENIKTNKVEPLAETSLYLEYVTNKFERTITLTNG